MENIPAFEDVFGAFMELYNGGRLDEARDLLAQRAPAYPEWDALVRIWQISLLARSGDPTAALDALQSALDAGIWYHEDALRNDPDLQVLNDSEIFQQLVARSADLRAASLQAASPRVEVLHPGGAGPWPLLVAFHGNNNSIAATLPAWQSVLDQGWSLAMPQSSLPSWLSGCYNWNFPEALDQAVLQIGALVEKQAPLDGRIVAGGFSMGAALALRLGLEGKLPVAAVIAVEPWAPDPAAWPPIIADCPLPGPRFFLVAGKDNSDHLASVLWLDELLRTAGFESTLILASNQYHRIPDEFPAILDQALSSLK